MEILGVVFYLLIYLIPGYLVFLFYAGLHRVLTTPITLRGVTLSGVFFAMILIIALILLGGAVAR